MLTIRTRLPHRIANERAGIRCDLHRQVASDRAFGSGRNGGTGTMEGRDLLRGFVLGQLSVMRAHTTIPLPPSKKTRALLAYLAVTARAHSRNRLCTIFWNVPDDPRAALRWSLSRLRPLVDAPDCRRIIADREAVGFNLDGVTVDIVALRELARNSTD